MMGLVSGIFVLSRVAESIEWNQSFELQQGGDRVLGMVSPMTNIRYCRQRCTRLALFSIRLYAGLGASRRARTAVSSVFFGRSRRNLSNSNRNRHLLRRWLLNLFRALHIAGLVGTGAGLLGGAVDGGFPYLLLGSGAAMVALDMLSNPEYLRQVAGAWVLAKLGLVAWLVLDTEQAPVLFWLILFLSVLVAHAPAGFRHRPWRITKTKGG